MKEKLTSLWQKLFGDSVRAFGVVSLVFLGFAGDRSCEEFLQRVASLSARLSQDDPQSQRCEYAAASLSGRHSADLAARTRRGRPLHQLPRWTEGSQPYRCFHAAVPHASRRFPTSSISSDARSAIADRAQQRPFPKRTAALWRGSSRFCRRNTSSLHAASATAARCQARRS